jgi:hypothetical protein
MKKKKKLMITFLIMFFLLVISVSAQNNNLNNTDPNSWAKILNWNSLNSEDLASSGAMEIIKKASVDQAISYFDGKLPADINSLNGGEKILLQKIYPNLHDDLFVTGGLIINNQDNSLVFSDGRMIFGIDSNVDITMTAKGPKIGDSIILDGKVTLNMDGSILLHENSQLQNKFATVSTTSLSTTVYTNNHAEMINSAIVFDGVEKQMFIGIGGVKIQLNEDQSGWVFEADERIDTPPSYILNKAGEKAIKISDNGMISSMLGVTLETGFDVGIDSSGNSNDYTHGTGFCCNTKTVVIPTGESILDVTGFGALDIINNIKEKCIESAANLNGVYNEIKNDWDQNKIKKEIEDKIKEQEFIDTDLKKFQIIINGKEIQSKGRIEIYNTLDENNNPIIWLYDVNENEYGELEINKIYEATVLSTEDIFLVEDNIIKIDKTICENCNINYDILGSNYEEEQTENSVGNSGSLAEKLKSKYQNLLDNNPISGVTKNSIGHQSKMLENHVAVTIFKPNEEKYQNCNENELNDLIINDVKDYGKIENPQKQKEIADKVYQYAMMSRI